MSDFKINPVKATLLENPFKTILYTFSYSVKSSYNLFDLV